MAGAALRRKVEPEWLDALAEAEPGALRARRDLRRINALMRNAAILAGAVQCMEFNPAPRVIAEIGAGDGTLMLALARRLGPQWRGTRVVLVDRQQLVEPRTLAGFAALGWRAEAVAADAIEWLARSCAPFDLIVANLFLHHFERAALRELLARVAACTQRFVACEPRRSLLALGASHLLGLIGCNAVTRHDAAVSVRAGFGGTELAAAWPADGWRLREFDAFAFSHCIVAEKAGR